MRARYTVGLGLAILGASALAGCIEVDGGPAPGSQSKPSPAPEAAPRSFEPAPPNGFNADIAWRTLDDGLAAVREADRPMMLIVHASWCPRCKELKPTFDDAEVAALAEKFVMVNVDQEEVPAALQFAPDGTYIPRVLFFDPQSGELDPGVLNERRTKFKYFYGAGDDLAATMKEALARYERS